jgi:hypothetical protein
MWLRALLVFLAGAGTAVARNAAALLDAAVSQKATAPRGAVALVEGRSGAQ